MFLEEEISSLETLAYLRNPALTALRRLTTSTLEDCKQSKLVSKDPLVQQNESSENVQRKITPWKSMNIETEQESYSQNTIFCVIYKSQNS